MTIANRQIRIDIYAYSWSICSRGLGTQSSFRPPLLTCARALRAKKYYYYNSGASTLERKRNTTVPPEFYDQRVSDCIVLLILRVQNDALSYLN